MIVFLLILLLLLGVPIAFSLAGALLVFMIQGDFPYHIRIVAQEMFGGIRSFPLLAIPLFILAGELMNEAGITTRIIDFTNAFVGRMRAGLAHVNIWSSIVFAGLSGSAIADTSSLGRVFIPEMEKQGYPRDFSAALTAASSVIGPIIPPSIPVIIYALTVTGVSVPSLFLAGIIPGLALAGAMSIYIILISNRLNLKSDLIQKLPFAQAILRGLIPVLMPVFVVGTILLGVVTPTEAAAFAVLYALVVGMVIYRTITVAKLYQIFARAMTDSAVIMIIIAAVSAMNWLLTYNRIPNLITEMVLTHVATPTTFLLATIVLLIFVGLFLEGIAAMLVLVPILHPIAVSLGIDPTHFGIMVIFNLMIGLITPPMGLCLFVSDAIAGVGMAKLNRRLMPMLLVEILVLLLIAFVPEIATFLPHLLDY